MLTTSDLVAFVASTDLGRSRAFYEGVLGLPVVGADGHACVLDAHGTMLRVTAVAELAGAPYTVLGWSVTDIDTTVRDLAARGVVFTQYDGVPQDDQGVWTTPTGERVAWFTDPDGNVLGLTQFA